MLSVRIGNNFVGWSSSLHFYYMELWIHSTENVKHTIPSGIYKTKYFVSLRFADDFMPVIGNRQLKTHKTFLFWLKILLRSYNLISIFDLFMNFNFPFSLFRVKNVFCLLNKNFFIAIII